VRQVRVVRFTTRVRISVVFRNFDRDGGKKYEKISDKPGGASRVERRVPGRRRGLSASRRGRPGQARGPLPDPRYAAEQRILSREDDTREIYFIISGKVRVK
jgi:hypothetical protein